mgnify:FL=1
MEMGLPRLWVSQSRGVPTVPADSLLPFRSSKRITVTLPQSTLEALNERSSQEGRSLSNLVAFLLESALKGRTL